MGTSYIDCLNSGIPAESLVYRIVVCEKTIAKGEKLFSGEHSVHFHQSVPENEHFDVVYIGSALQYVGDYKQLMNALMDLQRFYIFLTNHFMGDTQTYATAQVNMKDKVMPYWIFNTDEIVGIIAAGGYSLAYRSYNHQPFLHSDNFPERRRVENSVNLLFRRNTSN